jgi:hypothetical protein
MVIGVNRQSPGATMRNSTHLIPKGLVKAARMPAFALPVVKEMPMALQPLAPDTFGGPTGAASPTTPPRRGL